MPHRTGNREREYILTDRDGSFCGVVRIVQTCDGCTFEFSPGDSAPATRLRIPDTMRASAFLAAWVDFVPAEGLQLAG